MLTHTQFFKSLSIHNKIIWSEDSTKMSCMNCGKEFNQHGHMKIHIALVHYQLQNKDNLDTLNLADVSKGIEILDSYKKKTGQPETKKVECQECGLNYSKKSLKEHFLNVHIRNLRTKPLLNKPRNIS